MSGPEAIATGDLQSTSFGELLASAYQRNLSGSLVVAESAERRHCVVFSKGCPAKVQLCDAVEHLGVVMMELGLIDQDQLGQALEHSRTNGVILGKATESTSPDPERQTDPLPPTVL